MSVVLTLVAGALVAAGLEPWSRWVHREVWHRSLWTAHRSHHAEGRSGWEWNDLLALVHVPPSVLLCYAGTHLESPWLGALALGAGLGMAAFGVAYTVVHDGVIHGRLPVGFLRRWNWLEHIRRAHLVHHVRGEAPFGMFTGPSELRELRRRSTVSTRTEPELLADAAS